MGAKMAEEPNLFAKMSCWELDRFGDLNTFPFFSGESELSHRCDLLRRPELPRSQVSAMQGGH